MKLKQIVLATLLASAAFAGAAQASPTWTLTAEGRIAEGLDYAGYFGQAGQTLNGIAYKQTITVSVDPSEYGSVSSSEWQTTLSGSFPGFTESVTINGKTLSYSITQAINAQEVIANAASAHGDYYGDQIYSFQYGNDDHNNQVTGVIQAFTYYRQWAFVPTTDFGQKIVANGSIVNTYSSMNIVADGHAGLYFYAYPTLVTVNADDASSNVPEPASIALFGAGLLGLAALRRRKTC